MAKVAGRKGVEQNNHISLLRAILKALESSGALSSGLATESTLLNVLNAIVASHQDIEILLVRDTGNSNQVIQQITDYQSGVPIVSYKDVDNNVYTPIGPLEYLDPSAVLNIILTELSSLNTKVGVLDKYAIAREDTTSVSQKEYYGFKDVTGAWYILEIDLANGAYYYANGAAGTFGVAWGQAQSGTLVTSEFENLIW